MSSRGCRCFVWCAALAALAACQPAIQEGDQAHIIVTQPSAGDVAVSGIGGVSGASAGTGAITAGASADPGAYRVQLQAQRTALCPGECTSVRAITEGGTPPFTFAWSDDPIAGAETLEVCPTETTTYQVIATDSLSTVPEFGAADRVATGSVEIRVIEGCDVPDSGGEPAEPEPGEVQCELRVRYAAPNSISTSGLTTEGNLATDADGNAYFAATFMGTIEIGDVTLTSVGGAEGVLSGSDGVVVKLNAACEPVWVKTLGSAGASLELTTLALGVEGDVYVAGSIRGAGDFGSGAVGAADRSSGVLMKLDAEGELQWHAATFAFAENSMITRIAAAPDGDVIVTGFGPADLTFGLPLDVADGDFGTFLARVHASGEVQWVRGVLGGVGPLGLLVRADGSMVVSAAFIATRNAAISGDLIPLPLAQWVLMVAVLDPNARVVWGKAVRTYPQFQSAVLSTGVASSALNTVLVDVSGYGNPLFGDPIGLPPELIMLDPSGNELWTIERPYLRELTFWVGGVATDAEDSIYLFEQALDGRTAEDGSAIHADGGADILVSKRNAFGDLQWVAQRGGAAADTCWGLAPAPDGSVWAGWNSPLSDDFLASEIVLTRLAP